MKKKKNASLMQTKNHSCCRVFAMIYEYFAARTPIIFLFNIVNTCGRLWGKTKIVVVFVEICLFSDSRRNLKHSSSETFLMPTLSNIGKLEKIQVRQTFNSWVLKWKLNKVTVRPGWTGTQTGRSSPHL